LIFAIEISYLNKCNTKKIIVFQIKNPTPFSAGLKTKREFGQNPPLAKLNI